MPIIPTPEQTARLIDLMVEAVAREIDEQKKTPTEGQIPVGVHVSQTGDQHREYTPIGSPATDLPPR